MSFSIRGTKEAEVVQFENGNILASINKSYLKRQRVELSLMDSFGNILRTEKIKLGESPYLKGKILSVHFFNNTLYVALQQEEDHQPFSLVDELYSVNDQLEIRKVEHGTKPLDLSTHAEAFHISPNGKLIQIGSSFFNERMEHLANVPLIDEQAAQGLRNVEYLTGCLLNDGSAVTAYAQAAGKKGDLFNVEVECKITKTNIYSGEKQSFELSSYLYGLTLTKEIIQLHANDESLTVLLNTYFKGTMVLIINKASFTLSSEVRLNYEYLPKAPDSFGPMRFCIVDVFQELPEKGFLVGIMPHPNPMDNRYGTSLSLTGLYSYAIIDLKGVVRPLISLYRKGLETPEWHKLRQSARISEGNLHFLALKYSSIMDKVTDGTMAEIEVNRSVKKAKLRLFNMTLDINTGELKYTPIEKTGNISQNNCQLMGSKDGDYFGLCYTVGNRAYIRLPVVKNSLP